MFNLFAKSPYYHSLQTWERSKPYSYTSNTNTCNRLFPNQFIINFSDLIYTSLLVASGTQTIDFVYMCYTILLKRNLIKY